MKTFKDLKIDDAVFLLYDTNVKTVFVKSLTTDRNKCCVTFDHSKIDSNLAWDNIKDLTFVHGEYSSNLFYLNQSEVIIEIKKRLSDNVDKQIEVINKEMEKLADIKNQITKYL